MFDAYSLLLQSDIIASILECKYISVMNGTNFFYQWCVAQKDWEKFTITSHQELETPNVAIMNYKSSPSYTQCMMNSILCSYKVFTQCYINDIVVFFKILKDHLEHLDTVFSIFDRLSIFIKEIKIYLDYSSIILLD